MLQVSSSVSSEGFTEFQQNTCCFRTPLTVGLGPGRNDDFPNTVANNLDSLCETGFHP
jgi:hypothetical protein